ncbi:MULTISPECIES: RNA polymerase sigma factor [Flavobacteriaceae]|uniref:Sigma-70 family RNA polymerase sigma factor n=2 Tax=Flavobacteriaceae TaxID=49546 RepID=A0A4Y8AQG9_9FLAO|nr:MULTISPECIES: sigma-70 family RNA polymerase sigma factor [Flavobacteriaceae]TEW72074.1 sigma-70 family RNA polymerase sigma factor [Gramella jeungdoensis]GGK56214.1 DNA-directed RNA polymerase sigma-70 factor [Lutibacter litoralis]
MHTKEEFFQNIKENEGIIYKVARLYADSAEDQKDVYQEIVYQLWKSYPSFKKNSKISTWMYRVALNTAISNLKKEKRKGIQVPIDNSLLNRMDEIDTVMEEQITLLYAHIKKLSIVEKGIILLHLEGKNYDEIAAITGFTATNIGTRLARIKNKLKSQIKK